MSTPTPNTPRRFCLSELNRRCSSKLVIWILAAVVLVSAFLVYLVPLVKTGRLEGPPRSGDGPDYDALAVQLSKGNGFAVDLNDPDYQRPYQKPSQRDQSGDAPYEPQPSPRTSRPPLLPVVMALSIKVFGRQYAPVRVIMCLFMALAATGGFLLLARRFGVVPGLIAAAWFVYFDPRSKSWAHYILTEAPACLVVMLITWCLLRTVETGSRRWAAWLGVATALGFYTRAIIAVWMPVIAIVVFLLTRPAAVRWWRPGAWRMPGMVVGLFFAVSGPWMLRNCLLLRQFEPLGTMGSASLAAAYSDEAIKKEGIWFNLTRAGFFKEVLTDSQTPLEQERIAAAYSKRKALEWIAQNPGKLPHLALLKMQSVWRPRPPRAFGPKLLLVCAGLGALAMLSARPRGAVCYLGLLVACTLAVAVTWSVGGRFLVPVLPIICTFAGLGIWSVVVAATELAADRLPLPPRPVHGKPPTPRDEGALGP